MLRIQCIHNAFVSKQNCEQYIKIADIKSEVSCTFCVSSNPPPKLYNQKSLISIVFCETTIMYLIIFVFQNIKSVLQI
jgi:hypothetical protein